MAASRVRGRGDALLHQLHPPPQGYPGLPVLPEEATQRRKGSACELKGPCCLHRDTRLPSDHEPGM